MERIVIRSSNWLGDAVMSVPAVRALRRSNPGAHIAVLTPEKLADVWRLVAEVDEVIAFPTARGVLSIFRVAKLIRGRGFTDGVVFPNSLRTALEVWLARIPRRTGYPGHGRRAFFLNNVLRDAIATPDAPATAPGRHQVHHYLRLAEFLGAQTEPDASFGFPDASAKKMRVPGASVASAVSASTVVAALAPDPTTSVVRRANRARSAPATSGSVYHMRSRTARSPRAGMPPSPAKFGVP